MLLLYYLKEHMLHRYLNRSICICVYNSVNYMT